MNDLTAFLSARLDEEAAALEAEIAGVLERYHADGLAGLTREELLTPDPPHYLPEYPRQLREIAAKRAIIELQQDRAVSDVPDEVLLHLAAIYSDHPDYRQEWKP